MILSTANTDILIGDILLEAGQTGEARRRYGEAATSIQNSDLAENLKRNAAVRYGYNLARVTIADNQVDSAETLAENHFQVARERVDPAIKAQAHFLKAAIALKRQDFERALEQCELTDRHNPYHQYQKSIALANLGREAEAAEILSGARNANLKHSFPLAYVRARTGDVPLVESR